MTKATSFKDIIADLNEEKLLEAMMTATQLVLADDDIVRKIIEATSNPEDTAEVKEEVFQQIKEAAKALLENTEEIDYEALLKDVDEDQASRVIAQEESFEEDSECTACKI